MKSVIVATASGIRSIPLSQFPAEAWISAFGSDGDNGGILDRYEQVPWLYRGVNARADAIANLPFCFEIGGEESEDYQLPFDLQMDAFLNELEGDLTLFGAAYVWLDAGVPLRLRQVRRLYPGSIRPKYNTDAGLVGFMRTIGSERRFFTTEEIGYIWLPNRKRELGPGVPPGQAALRAAGALTYIDQFVEKFFEQGTIAPVILGLADGTEQSDVERIQDWFRRRLTGIRNAFGAIAVRGGIEPHVLAQNELDKLALEPLSTQKREDIATALGVPHSLLFSNAANYATAGQDALNWYELTIIPESRRIEQALNHQLFEPLSVRLEFKPDRLEMFQEREAEKAYKLVAFFDRRIVTRNEVREQAGFAPVDGGDELAPPAEPPPSEQQQNDMSEMDNMDDMEDGNRAFLQDLRRWKNKALSRLKASKTLAFSFESAAIEPSLAAAITGALEACRTAGDVRRVFDDAARWSAHEHG